jgi:hypothetical protein
MQFLLAVFAVLAKTTAQQIKVEPTFWYTLSKDGSCSGCKSLYVDDGLHTRSREMDEVVAELEKQFEFGKSGSMKDGGDHLGFTVKQTHVADAPERGLVEWSAPNYHVKPISIEPNPEGGKRLLDAPATHAEYKEFRTSLGRMSWLGAIDTCLLAPASILAGSVNELTKRVLLELNEIVQTRRLNTDAHIPTQRFKHIAKDDVCLVGFPDSSLGNRGEADTQFGGCAGLVSHASVMGRKEAHLNLLDAWSKKQRRVVKSTFS